ncbi:MAG TPA: metal-dependent hydrolase, partial [Nitrospiraceae bacterium]|nr:metal-dependent hydrolase [Nitrospiraceae bacterium]
HLMASWMVAHRLEVRQVRRLVAWAGVAADLDGLSIVGGPELYGRWHHALTHGLSAALLIALICAALAHDRRSVWWLSLTAFHLHLLCDWLGSGVEWPIQYWWPLNDTFYETPFGWELDAWPNWVVAMLLIAVCGRIAITSGHSFAETVLSPAADAAVVSALRRRFAPRSIPLHVRNT